MDGAQRAPGRHEHPTRELEGLRPSSSLFPIMSNAFLAGAGRYGGESVKDAMARGAGSVEGSQAIAVLKIAEERLAALLPPEHAHPNPCVAIICRPSEW